jgi:hypothetical protein
LKLDQKYQVVSGTLIAGGKSEPVTNGKLRGDQITFTAGGATYAGRVNGDVMSGEVKEGGQWRATRASGVGAPD